METERGSGVLVLHCFGSHISGREPLRAKSHARCWHTLMDVQEGKKGDAIRRRGPVNEAVDEIMRPPSSLVPLFAVNEIQEGMEFSGSNHIVHRGTVRTDPARANLALRLNLGST